MQAHDEAILLARTVGDAECMRACDRYVVHTDTVCLTSCPCSILLRTTIGVAC